MKDLDKLRIDIESCLNEIDISIMFVKAEAAIMRIDPHQMRYPDGRFVMQELLSSKVKAMHSLALLEDLKEIRRKRT
jgi:hypothetical protein